MTLSRTIYYECDDSSCKLRFPVYQGEIKPNRCPLCRSTFHEVLSTENPVEVSQNTSIAEEWDVEVMLDNIRSAWNVGAIFRTSDGLGIKKIYCCGISPSPDQSKISRTALGAEFEIPWERENNGLSLAAKLVSAGKRLWALEDMPGVTPLYSIDEVDGAIPTVLIVGNENCGVDPAILALCEKVISIPMLGKKQSYNVAVAFGMATCFLLYRHKVSHGSLRILPKT